MSTIKPESTTGIEQDIGLAIMVQPDEQTLLVYRRLLTGFSLIMERNAQGFDLIHEETSPADVEKILEHHWNPDALAQIAGLHGYWRTAILRSLNEARKKWAVLNGQLKWIEKIDPALHGAMVTAHMPFTPKGSEIIALHFAREIECGHACAFAGNTVRDDQSKPAMSDANLGLTAGLLMVACTIAIMLGHQVAGGIMCLIGLGFAVALGMSKRAKNKSMANRESK